MPVEGEAEFIGRRYTKATSPHLVGYARVSTNQRDPVSRQVGLKVLCVPEDLVYVDHGPIGRNCERPDLNRALAACRTGDTLVVTKLGLLARSLPDARDISNGSWQVWYPLAGLAPPSMT